MKKVIIFALVALTILSTVSVAFAGLNQKELSETVVSVPTSNGVQTLAAGIKVDGTPVHYVTISSGMTLPTKDGPIYFDKDTPIDCDDVPPGEQNPCDPF